MTYENIIDIRKLRKFRKWSQTAMGDHFGVSLATVWRWEHEGIPDRGAARKHIEREWSLAIEQGMEVAA